jgi:hypothetical protein
MRTAAESRSWRLGPVAIVALLLLGLWPVLGPASPVSAQTDELSQREFDDLVEEAQAEDPVFGPEEGELPLDPDRVTLQPADVEAADFLAIATFHNPYAGNRQQFDYGLQFRSLPDGDDAAFLRFIVISDGSWGITDGSEDVIEAGGYDDLDVSRRGENTLTLLADGDTVHLGINGDYVASVEVPYEDGGGAAVGTGFLFESYQEDAVTEYSDFTIWDLGGPARDTDDETGSDADKSDEPIEGTGYTSPTYGYSFEFDESWEVTNETSRRDIDTLELDNGTSSIQFVGSESTDTPRECVDAFVEEMQADNSLGDATIALDENDEEMLGESGDSAFVVLHVTVETGPAAAELTVFFSCVTIVEGESLLQVTHIANSDDYNDEIESRAAVLDTLALDGDDASRDEDEADADTGEEPDADADADAGASDEGSSDELPAGGVTFFLEATEEGGPVVLGTLIPAADRSELTVLVLSVDGESAEYEVTIHEGTCRRPGDAVFSPGSTNESGYLATSLDAPVEDLSSGDFVMLVSEDGTEDTAVACGELVPPEEE